MERAALDDPFLAEAMEGYAGAGINIGTDISLLKEKLDERTSKSKMIVLPMRGAVSGWWKIAAMIIIIAGGGLLVYQFAFNKQSNETAQLQKVNRKLEVPVGTVTDSVRNNDSGFLNNVAVSEEKSPVDKTNKLRLADKENPRNNFKTKSDSVEINNNVAASTSTVSVPAQKTDDRAAGEVSQNRGLNKPSVTTLQKAKSDERREEKETDGLSEGRKATVQSSNAFGAPLQTNVFRGQVLDPNFNPLPFANVTNTRDNVGTYSDAKGNFTLTSPDSVLNVQIRSIGFENRNAELKNFVSNNAVVLQEDKKSIKEDVVSYKKFNTSRNRDAGMVLEEPEPADGWSNYDAYIWPII